MLPVLSRSIRTAPRLRAPWARHIITPAASAAFADASRKYNSSMLDVVKGITPTQITTLPNGVRVASDETHGETATVGVWWDTGSRYEAPGANGVAHFLEHIMFKGTPRRSQYQLETEIENLGAHLNAYTSRENTIFYAKVLKKDVRQGLDVISDMLQNSKMENEAIERERGTILREMEEVDKQMEEVVFDRLHETAYRGSTMGNTILGPAESIQSISRDQLQAYRDTMLTGNRLVIAGTGPSHAELVNVAKELFGGIPAFPRSPVTKPEVRFTGSDIRCRFDDMPKCHLAIGFPTAGWNDPDNFPLMVMQAYIGSFQSTHSYSDYFPSELARKFHEETLGPAMTTFNTQYSDTGLFGVSAVMEATRLYNGMWNIMEEFRRLSYDVNPERLKQAKLQLAIQLLGSIETTTTNTEEIGRQVLNFGRRMHPTETLERINAVDERAINLAAKRYFWDRDFALAAVGPTWELPDYLWIRKRTYANRIV